MVLHRLSQLSLVSFCLQAQQRGVKQAAQTQPDADDPCAASWGDYAMVQSTQITKKQWTRVEDLNPEKTGKEVRQQQPGHSCTTLDSDQQHSAIAVACFGLRQCLATDCR